MFQGVTKYLSLAYKPQKRDSDLRNINSLIPLNWIYRKKKKHDHFTGFVF